MTTTNTDDVKLIIVTKMNNFIVYKVKKLKAAKVKDSADNAKGVNFVNRLMTSHPSKFLTPLSHCDTSNEHRTTTQYYTGPIAILNSSPFIHAIFVLLYILILPYTYYLIN